MKTRTIFKALAVLALMGCVVWGVKSAYAWAYARGKADCEAKQTKADLAKEQTSKAVTAKRITRAHVVGQQAAQGSAALDGFFDGLQKESRDAPPADFDTCVLPDDRLRRWAAANAGRATGSATLAEPDASAASPAAPSFWPRARLGGQPPPDGAAIPPVGPTLLPAAGSLPAHAAGLPAFPARAERSAAEPEPE